MRRTPIAVAAVMLAVAATFGVTRLTGSDGGAPNVPGGSYQKIQESYGHTDAEDQLRRQKQLREAALRDLADRVDQQSEALRRAQNDGS